MNSRMKNMKSSGSSVMRDLNHPAWSVALHPTFILRTGIGAQALLKPIALELAKLDPWLRESEVLTLRDVMRDRFAGERNVIHLLGELAAVALGLTVLGAYGMMSYLVTQRTQEIGIRLAVGAQRAQIAMLILKFGLWLALAGVSLGLPAALCGSLLLRHVAFEVSPFDLPAFLMAAGAVTAAIALACWLPARRASRVDPVEALHHA